MEHNPTEPQASIEISGVTYGLCFTFGQLAAAETILRKQGNPVNMLSGFYGERSACSLSALFYAALLQHHPDMTYEKASGLITIANAPSVLDAVTAAMLESLPKTDEPEKNE